MKYIKFIILALILLFSSRLYFLGIQSQKIDVKYRELIKCNDTLHCSSTQLDHKPLKYKRSPTNARETLKIYLTKNENFLFIFENENFWHIECKSSLFGFVDDLTIFFDDNNKTIHMASKSRVGHSDLGANKRRIKKLKSLFL